MPKFRSIHTKITQSFDFNEMPDDFTRLLWVLLPLGLDCEGRGIYNASWIKSKIFPLREDVTQVQITSGMEWFAARGMVNIYDVDNRQYFWVIKFQEYQRGFEKEAPSLLPAPFDTYSIPTPELVKSNSPLNTYTESNAQSESNADAKPSKSPTDAEFFAHFGNFNNQREQKRWIALVESVGFEQAQRIAEWAEKKEINMTNRMGLMDSMETAAKNWKQGQSKPGKKDSNEDFFTKLNKLRIPEVIDGNA